MEKKYLKKVNAQAKTEHILKYNQGENGFLSFKRYYLEKDVLVDKTAQEEGVLIILAGSASITVKDLEVELKRADVFSDKPEAVYIPIDTSFEIETTGNFEGVLVATPCEKTQDPYFIAKDDIDELVSGKKEWERDVRMIQKPDSKSFKLIIGETLNKPGLWSGIPPHKHDVATNEESILKEVYYFKIDPASSGFGAQFIYNEACLNEVYKLEGEEVVFLPEGYHPVVAAPGTKLYYLWILAGPSKDLKVTIDQRFKDLD